MLHTSNPLISVPRGRIIAKLDISVDQNGRTEFHGFNCPLIGAEAPMHPISMASLLSQVLASIMVQQNAELLKLLGAAHDVTKDGPSEKTQ